MRDMKRQPVMCLLVLCGPSNTSLSSKGFPSHLACAASQWITNGAQCLIIGTCLFEFTRLFLRRAAGVTANRQRQSTWVVLNVIRKRFVKRMNVQNKIKGDWTDRSASQT